MQCNSSSSTSYPWVNNTDEHCIFGEVPVSCSQYPCSRRDILRSYAMCNINDMRFRSNSGNYAFHYTNIPITDTKICHNSDNWTWVGGILLRHVSIALPFFMMAT